ncbi:FUSC family protein [Acuticoccus kandeliae]|uniref:FUSC family protein n=1 Tax=Acuticoccus kandeliae TaxID=2073160 RepID=UPI000D3EA478|nr:FUSC family protein [Acuticoccus kandeliae]
MSLGGSTAAAPGTRRIDAARHLLRPQQVRESMALGRQPSLRNAMLAGMQAAITMVIALPLAHVSPWPHLIGFAALGALVALFGRFAPAGRRSRIVLYCALCQTGAVLLMSTVAWLGAPVEVRLVLLALACGAFYFATTTGEFGPPGALIFVFAAGAAMGDAASLSVVGERTIAVGLVAALAWLVCAATERLRHPATAERAFPAEPFRPASHRLLAAARIALGAAIAVFAAYAVGAAHPTWAAMGAVAVMQGAHLHINMNRALQRMAGTVVGAVVVWLILLLDPTVGAVIAVLAILQFSTELIIGSNYAVGQILVTPMALLMSHLAAPEAASVAMAPERVLDTIVGAAVGIAIAILLSTLDDRTHLANLQAARSRG